MQSVDAPETFHVASAGSYFPSRSRSRRAAWVFLFVTKALQASFYNHTTKKRGLPACLQLTFHNLCYFPRSTNFVVPFRDAAKILPRASSRSYS